MSVLDLILNHNPLDPNPQVSLLWEMRCDCAPDRSRLIGAVYAHEGNRHFYLPSMKGRHAATGVIVRRAPAAPKSAGPTQPTVLPARRPLELGSTRNSWTKLAATRYAPNICTRRTF
jgi:hypothetical protein